MSNVRISGLPVGPALVGTELLEMSNSLVSQSTTAAAIVTLGNTYTADHDADGFDIRDISNLELRETTGAPAGTVRAVYANATGMNINAIATTIFSVLVAGTSEFTVSATEVNAQGNNIVGAADITLTGNVNFPDGVRQIFNPNNTNSGLNVGENGADPSGPVNGDIYYQTGVGFRARTLGAWITLGAGGGGIATINGDATAAQVIAAGTGLGIVDVGATHTLSIDATVATLTGAQVLTNKSIAAASNTLTIASTDLTDTAAIVLETQANTFSDGFRQTFGPNGTNSGLNVGENGADPSAPVNGDLYYQTGVGFRARTLGAWITLGAGGGGEVFTWTANHDANGFALEAPSFADPTDTTKLLNIDLAGNATTVTLTLDINQSTTQTLTVPNITAADNLVTDNVAATLLSKTLGTGTVFSVAPTINDGIRFIFNPNATDSGLNVGAHTADPSSPVDGDLFYNSSTNELRARINAAWVTVGQPDTPWTVDHDFDRYSVLNAGSIIWPILDPRTVPAGTTPNIYFEEDPSIDHLRINVPASAEFRIYVNNTEEYSFSASQFDPQQNAINNAGNITINTASATGILTVGRSNELAANNAGEIRFRGGNDEYGQIEVEMTNVGSGTERGTMRFQVSANDLLVDMITLTGSTSGANSTISFNNRLMASQINMNNNRIDNVFDLLSNDSQEATAGFIRMGDDEYIAWRNNADTQDNGITFNAAGQFELSIGSITAADYTFSATVFDLIGRRIQQLLHIQDANQNEQLIFASVASAVNELTITNAATGNPALLTATGEANAALTIATSGTGVITLSNDVVASGDIVMGDRFQGNKGPDVASADAITLGDGNYFDITGVVTINHMINTNWQDGSVVTLQFDGAVTVTNAAGGATGAEADFALAGAVNFVSTAGDTLTLVYDGTLWREIARSVN